MVALYQPFLVALVEWEDRPRMMAVAPNGVEVVVVALVLLQTSQLVPAEIPFTAAELVAEVGAYLLEMPVKVTARVEPLGSMAAALPVAPMERRAELAPQATPTRSLVAAVVAVVAVVLARAEQVEPEALAALVVVAAAVVVAELPLAATAALVALV